MKRIIINADDFGINENVTAEIERMVDLGAISSTTILANGKCLDEVKTFAKEHQSVSFGVHLCLSEFSSVTKSEALMKAGLTDEKGVFIHKAVFNLKDYKSEYVKQAIRDELNAQIDIVFSLGFPVSHADSHHHVHTIYPLRKIFSEVLQNRNIKKLRLGGDFSTWRMKAHIGMWIQRLKLNRYYRGIFTTTDDFYSYAQYLQNDCPSSEGGVIELMCHPGHPGHQYQEEMVLVEAKKVLTDNSIKLVSYNELY